jgi:hypothetical protein
MIRALLSAGPARQFIKHAPLTQQIIYHSEQLAELREVAARPRLKIAPEAVTELIKRIERYGERIDADLETIAGAPLKKRVRIGLSGNSRAAGVVA